MKLRMSVAIAILVFLAQFAFVAKVAWDFDWLCASPTWPFDMRYQCIDDYPRLYPVFWLAMTTLPFFAPTVGLVLWLAGRAKET